MVSVAFYLARCAAGRPPEEASLLSYYFETAAGRKGHTVLLFRERGRRWVYDFYEDERPQPLPVLVDDRPLALAAAVMPPGRWNRPDRAVRLPLLAPETRPLPTASRSPVPDQPVAL